MDDLENQDILPPKGFEFSTTHKAYFPDGTLRCRQTTYWWGMDYPQLIDLEEAEGLATVQSAVDLGRKRFAQTATASKA